MPGYKQPCLYCDKLVPADSGTCPFCGRRNPIELRCPKCRSPIERSWRSCSTCGFILETVCPVCHKPTFYGDYCDKCDASLMIICPNPKCHFEQFPLGEKCVKCGKKLRK